MCIANGLETADVEGHRQRRRSRFGDRGQGIRLFDVTICSAVRQGIDQTPQLVGYGLDHRLFARDDDANRVLPEESGPDRAQLGDDLSELICAQAGYPPHLVQHADPLQAVVDSALGAELGGGSQDGELKAQARDRALESGRTFVDDLFQPVRLDFQFCGQIREEIDERADVAVERPARDQE